MGRYIKRRLRESDIKEAVPFIKKCFDEMGYVDRGETFDKKSVEDNLIEALASDRFFLVALISPYIILLGL